jgi:hypothetical protein
MAHLKLFGLSMALIVVLAASSVAAEQPRSDVPKPSPPADPAAALEKIVKEQITGQFKDLKDRLERIETTIGQLNKEFLSQKQVAIRDLENLKEQIRKLEEQLQATAGRAEGSSGASSGLSQRLPQGPSTRIAAAPPTGSNLGTIRLRNHFPGPISIVVNGRSNQLIPGETVLLESQPVGSFTFEVLGIEPSQTRSLAPGETITITVYPKP